MRASMEIVQAFKTMEEHGALTIDYQQAIVKLNTELFWHTKSEEWRANFRRNIASYIAAITQKEPIAITNKLKLIDIDTDKVLV